LIEKLHDAAACVTVNGRSAIVIVPLRGPPVLPAALNATVPLPVPDAAPVIEIQDAFAVADQLQPAPAVTLIEPLPPPDAIDASDGERLYVHAGAGGGDGGRGGGGDAPASAWVTVTGWSAIATDAVRAGPPFASTVSFTAALPEPVAV
jgi:hypothetical protein